MQDSYRECLNSYKILYGIYPYDTEEYNTFYLNARFCDKITEKYPKHIIENVLNEIEDIIIGGKKS